MTKFIYIAYKEKKEKQTNALSKKIDRHLRKANKDVDMDDEILSQVSVSHVAALTIFLAYQKTQNVQDVCACGYMPIRYNANLVAGIMKEQTTFAREEFEQIHDKNQFNITNKFFNTILRYAHHFGSECEFDDIEEKINLKLNKKPINSENILIDIENSVINYEKKENLTI